MDRADLVLYVRARLLADNVFAGHPALARQLQQRWFGIRPTPAPLEISESEKD